MALFRKLFYRKPPDGLLEISERVYVFDCCFSTEVWDEKNYKAYVGGVISELREYFPDASILVFNFRDAEWHSRIASALSEYDMTIMDYPRHYEGCPLLPMEVIHHFLRSSESWLSLGQQNLLVMHCERGGWPVLAFMLAALLIYRKQYSGEQKILDMVYKQAPKELLHLLAPLNPLPSQLRYLQYISRRNLVPQWPPLDRALSLDCVIIRMIPNTDGEGGCRPIFRIYGQDPSLVGDRSPKLLFTTPKRNKAVRQYKQAECELAKIDINCDIQGDVVLECSNLFDDMEREKMIFRAMFNTAFIRSNILMLNRDDIDILWDAKDQFPKDFRAEVLFSEMDAAACIVPAEKSCFEEKEGLPMEAFATVNEIFNSVDWLAPKAEAALSVIQQVAASNVAREMLSPHVTEISTLSQELANEMLQEKVKFLALEEIGKSSQLASNDLSSSATSSFLDENVNKLAAKLQALEISSVNGNQVLPLGSPSKPHSVGAEKSDGTNSPLLSSLLSPEYLLKSTLGHVSSQTEPYMNLQESDKKIIPKSPKTASAEFIASLQPPKDVSVHSNKLLPPASVPPPPDTPPVMQKIASRTRHPPPPPPPPPPPMILRSERVYSSDVVADTTVHLSHASPPQMHLSPATPKLEDKPVGIKSPPSELPNIASSLAENVSERIVTVPLPPPPPPPPLASITEMLTASRPHPPPPPCTSSTSTENASVGSESQTYLSPPHHPLHASLSGNEAPRTGSIPPLPPPLPSQPGIASSKVAPIPPPPPPMHPSTPSLIEGSSLKAGPPPPAPTSGENSASTSGAPQPPPPPKDSVAFTGGSIPPPPPPLPISRMTESSAPGTGPPPPPPPPPPLHSGPTVGHSSSVMPPPPPPPMRTGPAKHSSSSIPSAPPPPMLSKDNSKSPVSVAAGGGGVPGSPSPPPPSAPLPGVKGRSMLSRTITSKNNQTKKLKPLHWLKLTRAVQGSLWAETQKSGEASKAPDIDISELESLFSAAVPTLDQGASGRKGNSRASLGQKPEKVQLIEHRRAYNCEIMLSKVKIPLPDLLVAILSRLTTFLRKICQPTLVGLQSSVLALEDSALDVDQVENLIKFCPTKEEMEMLKGYKGERDKLGKCEQFFLELMQVPRIEPKLRVFSFKIQFRAQVAELQKNLNIVNSTADQIRDSAKLKRIMQTILSLGNALNQGTARGSAVGFRLDSLLKLTETRARNNKMTLMHYLCKVLADKLPELLDFSKDLSSLEPAAKIQLKFLAEEMQAISKGLEKVIQELSMSENDGPVSEIFCQALKDFLSYAEGEVRSLASLYSGVGRNVDSLILYFGEDPARCPFEQVISTILNFVKMFNQAHQDNCKQIEFERKKADKEAAADKLKLNASGKGTENIIPPPIRS